MAKKTSIKNPLLDDIFVLHTLLEGSRLSQAKLASVASFLEHPKAFFKCNDLQAVVLSLLLNAHYQNEEISVSMLIRHLCLKPSASLKINKALAPFVDKGWLKPVQDLSCQPMATYSFSNRFLKCVTAFDWNHQQEEKATSDFEMLELFRNLVGERKERLMSYKSFIKKTEELIQCHQELGIPSFIYTTGMSAEEKALFLKFCLQFYQGEENVEIDETFRELGPNREEQFHLRQRWKAGKGVFFEKGLVEEYNDAGFFGMTSYRLSKKVKLLLTNEVAVANPLLESGLYKAFYPEKILKVDLFYPAKTASTVKKLGQLLEPERYKVVKAAMSGEGMIAGVSILLHGSPGTGKTETALQLARESDRILLSVDASLIRSKWVGESEKNARQLFENYRTVVAKCEKTPILLFNEADALFGKRGETADRVQQMENALQNILLDELERFEGILIATTNLTINFDQAFERRFLYKIHLAKPGAEVVTKIWKAKFPELPTEVVERLSRIFDLTGAQLENIRKKILVDQLLDPALKMTEELLSAACENEVSLENGKNKVREPIGFIR